MDNETLKLAKQNFDLIKSALSDLNQDYREIEDEFALCFNLIDKNVCNTNILIKILPDQKLIKVMGRLDIDISKDKNNILALAIATSHLNFLYTDGSWDFSYHDNYIGVRLTTNYWDSLLSKDVIKNILSLAVGMIDDDALDLVEINSGNLSIKDFLKKYD